MIESMLCLANSIYSRSSSSRHHIANSSTTRQTFEGQNLRCGISPTTRPTDDTMKTVDHQLFITLTIISLIIPIAPFPSVLCAAEALPVAHLALSRRGGAAAHQSPANLTHLAQILQDVERRYTRVKREVKGNKLVRKWKARSTGTAADGQLLGEPGQDGRW
jgi:hypothetical protein